MSPSIETALFDVHYDGQATWIHADGFCVARYGNHAFEIYSGGDPQRLVRHGETGGLTTWRAFAAALREIHGYAVHDAAAPERFHPELGVIPPEPVEVPLDLLAEWNPLERNPWLRDPCDRKAVDAMLALGATAPDYVEIDDRDGDLPYGWDARRVAHMVLYPDRNPIAVQVTSTHGHIEINDGWHRLCAAFYRGDSTIPAVIEGEPLGRELAFPSDRCHPVTNPDRQTA